MPSRNDLTGVILPQRHFICQPQRAVHGVSSPISTPAGDISSVERSGATPNRNDTFESVFEYSAAQVTLVRGAAQEVEHTSSRRSGPRRWLRVVAWSIAAGLHPRAGATTVRVAEDLAERMDYDTGHARYCLDETAARLGINRSTVKRHVAVLRELGLLAWVMHGTRTNIRRALGLKGYAGTATVYAATIPPVYDHAMGHTLIGTGYTARIVIDQRGQQPAGADAPPSLTVVKKSPAAEVESGFKNTSRERATRPTAPISLPTQKTAGNSGGAARRRPAAQVARDCRIAAQVRPRVNWTQGEGIRRLAHALRPLIDQGLDVHDIVAELGSWWLTWRPSRPAAYIRVQLAKQQALEAERAAAVDPEDNAEWQALCEQQAADAASLEALFGRIPRQRTDDDRRTARAAGRVLLQRVIDHLEEHGDDDTLDLYGTDLAARAAHAAASTHVQIGARW